MPRFVKYHRTIMTMQRKTCLPCITFIYGFGDIDFSSERREIIISVYLPVTQNTMLASLW